MKSLVSVIVPVYKVENYLVRCLDSLCRQSLHEIEVILVDDASPDQCGKICEEYAAKDIRFKVFHHEVNKGLSEARNTGILHAAADYLMFVDSDDWVHEDFCQEAYQCVIQYKADLVMFKLVRVKEFQFFKIPNCKSTERSLDGYKTHIEAMELLYLKSFGNSACNKLYKKSLFKDIMYPGGYYYEDFGTTYKIIQKASRIYCLDKTLYYYCFRKNSITSMKSKKVLEDQVKMAMQRNQDLYIWGYATDMLEFNLINTAMLYCIGTKRNYKDPQYVFFANKLKTCNKTPSCFSWKRKTLFLLFKYCQPLFELVCILCNKKRI